MDYPAPRKARNLREAPNQLDPEHPLESPASLDAYFVARPDSPIDGLRILLEARHTPQKILFTGHRGSGKSTELAKLANELEDSLIVIRYSAKSILNPLDLSYVDVILSIGLVLFEKATQLDVSLDEGVLDHVLRFTRRQLATLSSGIPRELIALGRQAALEALRKGREQVDVEDVEHAAQRKRRDDDVSAPLCQRIDIRSATTTIRHTRPFPHLHQANASMGRVGG